MYISCKVLAVAVWSFLLLQKLDEESQREASVEEAEAEVTPEENQNDVVVSRRKPSKTKRTPKLDNVVDALKYKASQPTINHV